MLCWSVSMQVLGVRNSQYHQATMGCPNCWHESMEKGIALWPSVARWVLKRMIQLVLLKKHRQVFFVTGGCDFWNKGVCMGLPWSTSLPESTILPKSATNHLQLQLLPLSFPDSSSGGSDNRSTQVPLSAASGNCSHRREPFCLELEPVHLINTRMQEPVWIGSCQIWYMTPVLPSATKWFGPSILVAFWGSPPFIPGLKWKVYPPQTKLKPINGDFRLGKTSKPAPNSAPYRCLQYH